ncbi:MAG: Gfo/Idh/MocA family oxidoreductase, partial [Anaerolineae bacterium]|nr:Gfo/Idh/MocA family oxidoreductase [Anaerolineae bacterium]
MTAQRTGYGITGCGYFGTAQARVLAALPGARVAAVHSGTGAGATRIAAELGCVVCPTLDDLVAHPEVDAVIVATPNHLHREPVIRAAAHGKHVFCEKPLALSLADCDAMLAACREADVTLMVGHILHFHSGMVQVRQWLDDGIIGRPLVAHVERTGWEPPRAQVSWKKMQALSGGHLFHHIHEIDLLLWYFGPVREVYATGGNLAHHGAGYGDEDDVILLTLRFANGAVGSMQYGSGFRWGEHLIKLNGTEGAILVDNKAGAMHVLQADRTQVRHPLFADAASQASLQRLFAATDGGTAYGTPADRLPAYLGDMLVAEMRCFHDVLNGAAITAPQARL